jgi:hypothetical protein
MVLYGAGLVAPWANRPVRVVECDRRNGFLDGWQQFGHRVDPATAQAVLVEVAQQGIESLVSRQDDAFGVGLSLDDPSKLMRPSSSMCLI